MSLPIRLLAFVLLIATAQFARALPIVELTWTDTTGSGAVGGSVITADPGDQLRLLISVSDPDAEIGFASLSLYWDLADLTGMNPVECPSPENSVAGTCDPAMSPVFTPIMPGVTLNPGEALGFDALSLGMSTGLAAGESLFLGAIDIVVAASARLENITVGYTGSDGIVTNEGFFRPLAVAILDADPEIEVPAPATLFLFGLALLGLRVARK